MRKKREKKANLFGVRLHDLAKDDGIRDVQDVVRRRVDADQLTVFLSQLQVLLVCRQRFHAFEVLGHPVVIFGQRSDRWLQLASS